MTISELEAFALAHCQYEQSWATAYLSVVRYTSYAITIGLFVVGLRYHELYLVLFGFGLVLDSALNYALKLAARQPVPGLGTCGSHAMWCTPRIGDGGAAAVGCNAAQALAHDWSSAMPTTTSAGCVSCGMPNFELQHATFFVTALLVYAMQWYAPHFHAWHVVLLSMWPALVTYVHLYFGYADALQCVVAAAAGALFALVWQQFVYAVVVPKFPRLLRWRFLHIFGDYIDTMTTTMANKDDADAA